ncbi:MAG: ABC transporter substrate-binding protein [Lachnospiraceae bacterium]|nr:ABC transporter substrate-binding protein [Lachnospiraceae bacterium]
MKAKYVTIILAVSMIITATGCGQGKVTQTEENSEAKLQQIVEETEDSTAEEVNNTTERSTMDDELSYASVTIGETGVGLKTTIKMLTNRTDMMTDIYPGKNYQSYVDDFNRIYPDITVEIEAITDYADDAMLRLQGGDWGDIMQIPGIDNAELPAYFIPFGTVSEMEKYIRFPEDRSTEGICYGVPTTGDAQGMIYNKKVFKEAGITTLPKTPEEFIEDLKLIKEKTDAIPLYTNYAAGWTMGAWDAYITGTATADSEYENRKMLHTRDPFSDPGDGTHAYNVYKILYEAVANGLIEDDYTTTDWEGCKGMCNRGEIGTMALGSWAFAQMQAGGDTPEDVGYMPFPITVNGKQYASTAANYSFGINVNSSDDNKLASMLFVKWMTEDSGFAYNEGGMPIAVNDNKWPPVYEAFDENNVVYVTQMPAVEGEEDLKNTLNADSELALNNGGDRKVQEIVEHAAASDMAFDDIMAEWNAAWTEAQEMNNVEIKY